MTDIRQALAQEQEPEWIEDGFGTMWQKCEKKDCGKFVVRVGKVDCWNSDCPEKKQEPVDWEAVAADQAMTIAMMKIEQEPEWVATIGNWGKVQWREDVFPQLGAKLYTAPPKREWVGLTRRELDIATLGLEDLSDCYQAIEAKLKEKNT